MGSEIEYEEDPSQNPLPGLSDLELYVQQGSSENKIDLNLGLDCGELTWVSEGYALFLGASAMQVSLQTSPAFKIERNTRLGVIDPTDPEGTLSVADLKGEVGFDGKKGISGRVKGKVGLQRKAQVSVVAKGGGNWDIASSSPRASLKGSPLGAKRFCVMLKKANKPDLQGGEMLVTAEVSIRKKDALVRSEGKRLSPNKKRVLALAGAKAIRESGGSLSVSKTVLKKIHDGA